MLNSDIYIDYKTQLDKLREIVNETNESIISESPIEFVENNVNFFTKSFLVNLCAYLESFLKDITFSYIENFSNKINESKLPHNLILWSLHFEKEIKDHQYRFDDFKIGINKRDLDDHISGSPFRTIKLFKSIGVDLPSFEEFQDKKERINMIVVKRNKVLHHNDDASDLSFSDILDYINDVDAYMASLDQIILQHTA